MKNISIIERPYLLNDFFTIIYFLTLFPKSSIQSIVHIVKSPCNNPNRPSNHSNLLCIYFFTGLHFILMHIVLIALALEPLVVLFLRVHLLIVLLEQFICEVPLIRHWLLALEVLVFLLELLSFVVCLWVGNL